MTHNGCCTYEMTRYIYKSMYWNCLYTAPRPTDISKEHLCRHRISYVRVSDSELYTVIVKSLDHEKKRMAVSPKIFLRFLSKYYVGKRMIFIHPHGCLQFYFYSIVILLSSYKIRHAGTHKSIKRFNYFVRCSLVFVLFFALTHGQSMLVVWIFI